MLITVPIGKLINPTTASTIATVLAHFFRLQRLQPIIISRMPRAIRTAPKIQKTDRNASGTRYVIPATYANPTRIAAIALSQYKTARIVKPEGRTVIRGTRSEDGGATRGLSCLPQFQQNLALASTSFPHLKQYGISFTIIELNVLLIFLAVPSLILLNPLKNVSTSRAFRSRTQVGHNYFEKTWMIRMDEKERNPK